MITTCLFDLGNVLLRFSHEKMFENVAEVMGVDPETVAQHFREDELFWRYEAGQVSTSELLSSFRRIAVKQYSDTDWLYAASDIFDEMVPMVELLEVLRGTGKKLVLVSNTSDMHMTFARRRFQLFNYFDELVFSYQIKAMKPDLVFYDRALVQAGVQAQECLFVDDMPANVDGARKLGILAHQFTSVENARQFVFQVCGISF